MVSGRWPTAANELVVALDSNGRLPERLEYTLGLRDYGQLQNAMAKLRQNEGVNSRIRLLHGRLSKFWALNSS